MKGAKLNIEKWDIYEIAEIFNDGIYVTNGNGIVISANEGFSRITGIGHEEIIGNKISEILEDKYLTGEYITLKLDNISGVNNDAKYDEHNTIVSEKPIPISELVLKSKNSVAVMGTIIIKGEKRQVIIKGKPYFDDCGFISHVITVMREVNDLFELKDKLQEAENKSQQYRNELKRLKKENSDSSLIGNDVATQKIRELINQVAKTDATILITGETGSGKEVVAKEVYRNSSRTKGPYIKINCAAIPESLLESELFGYEKGSFTGALNKEKLGYFEMAHGGTLLLDEIGEMPLKLQSKLLRVLQEREVTRIGGRKPVKIDVRIIAATNQKLERQIREGSFREDLFYRLNVIPIKIEPLRERKDDIDVLAYKFLEKFSAKYNKNKELDISAIEALESYSWPGNVRELENTIERLVIVSDKKNITINEVERILGRENINYDVSFSEGIRLKDAVNKLEKRIIENTLKKYKSSYKAAEVLGITQPTVIRKAKSLGISKW